MVARAPESKRQQKVTDRHRSKQRQSVCNAFEMSVVPSRGCSSFYSERVEQDVSGGIGYRAGVQSERASTVVAYACV